MKIKENRKDVKMTVEQYETLKDYAESKGIKLGDAITEMQKDIDLFKDQSLTTVSDNAKMFCDQVDSLAECGRLPSWLVDAIKVTIRPIVLQGMINKKDIDFEALRQSWKIPENIKYIPEYEIIARV